MCIRDRYAATLKGREQLAVAKFAEAMEIVPKTLAENAGIDAIDKIAELKSSHSSNKNVGLNCLLYTSPSPRDRTRSRMPSSA